MREVRAEACDLASGEWEGGCAGLVVEFWRKVWGGWAVDWPLAGFMCVCVCVCVCVVPLDEQGRALAGCERDFTHFAGLLCLR